MQRDGNTVYASALVEMMLAITASPDVWRGGTRWHDGISVISLRNSMMTTPVRRRIKAGDGAA